MARGILVVLAVLLAAPLGSAYHSSVGATDSSFVHPSETPESPSVSSDLVALGRSSSCTADQGPFCGALRYHPGTILEQASGEDQEAFVEGWDFDAVYVVQGPSGVSTCLPWCEGLEDLEPGGSEDRGWQDYAVFVSAPGPVLDHGVGNGWILPASFGTFMAFLTDADGSPIDHEQLRNVVADAKDQGLLATEALPIVCGHTPESQYLITMEDPCDLQFYYLDGDEEAPRRCASPTYICDGLQPAWYGSWVCLSRCIAFDSTRAIVRWHFVVAPSLSNCNGLQEPGFLFETGAPLPYLAHDLDVYLPAVETIAPEPPRGGPVPPWCVP